jgi:poly(A) polymerase
MTVLKLACLLHDISKPATKTVESSGRIRFLGHHTEGAEVAERILKRLRFSRRAVDLISLMVHHHLRPSQMAPKGELPSGKAVYRYYRDAAQAAIDTLYLNMADYLAARGSMLEQDDWQEHCRVVGHILSKGFEQKAPENLSKLVTGYDIMESFALGPGPKVGELLNLANEAWANGDVNTKEEALELVRANLGAGVSGA